MDAVTDRQQREEKVLETVRDWLPELTIPGMSIQVTAHDPGEHDGAMFSVVRTDRPICRRGS
jgi:hypothetical protein